MGRIFTLFLALLCFSISLKGHGQDYSPDAPIPTSDPYRRPGGVLLVGKGDSIVQLKAYGLADLELRVPMQTQMVFQIGSVSKQFTAVGILMLVQEGKLNLSDPVTRFIPDFPNSLGDISIHHLLNHTSGIMNYTELEFFPEMWRHDLDPSTLIEIIGQQELRFAPGSQWEYSNSNYILLGFIIEQLSGLTYEEFIQKRIFTPLNMQHSGYMNPLEIIEHRSRGYQVFKGYRNAEYLSPSISYAGGGLMSTAEDLFKWYRAIKAQRLLKPELWKLAHSDFPLNSGKLTHYGYGWEVNEIQGSPTLQHSGSTLGFVSQVIWCTEEDLLLILLTNCNCGNPLTFAKKLVAELIGKPYPDPPREMVTLSKNQLERYLGNYYFEDGSIRRITEFKGKLYCQLKEGKLNMLYPLEENRFAFESGLTEIRFSTGPGEQHLAELVQGLQKVKGYRISNELNVMDSANTDEHGAVSLPGLYRNQSDLPLMVRQDQQRLWVYGLQPEGLEFIRLRPFRFQSVCGTYTLTFSMLPAGDYQLVLKSENTKILANKITEYDLTAKP